MNIDSKPQAEEIKRAEETTYGSLVRYKGVYYILADNFPDDSMLVNVRNGKIINVDSKTKLETIDHKIILK